MRLYIGTSGYSYKEWKGTFYPEDLPQAQMLRYYAERFETVEINNTFYRMPAPKLFEQWKTQVPPSFQFAIKAPQTITHRRKLVDAGNEVDFLFKSGEVLGDQLGPVLFQLPPYFRCDSEVLRSFVSHLPADRRSAFEFRHETWFVEEVFDILRGAGCALCLSHTDDDPGDPAIISTAPWGYLRLRRTDYAEGEIERWKRKIELQNWESAYVFFKHEDQGKGPDFAKRLKELPS